MTAEQSMPTELRRLFRHQAAVAECSSALLHSDDVSQIGPALQELLNAFGGRSLFVERNLEDPEAGLCTDKVHAAVRPGLVIDTAYWASMPWSRLPDSFDRLSRGKAQITEDVATLGHVERETLQAVGITAQLIMPIFVEGAWEGVVGVAEDTGTRRWLDDEIELLRTVANMIAAFWEKRATIKRLQAAVATSEEQLRYQFSLAQCSDALLDRERQTALPKALDALMGATTAECGFIALNEDHPVLGPSYREVYSFSIDGSDLHRDLWEVVPWKRTPESHEALSAGRLYEYSPDEAGSAERAFYESSPLPILSKLDVPVFVDGAFAGLIGFVNHDRPHEWTESEKTLLRTAAHMVGSFLSRQQAWEQLEGLVRSKDEFVAGVSHELRTPLSIVVGLACELRDRAYDFSKLEQMEFHRLIASEAIEVANLVEDLLIAARSDIGSVVVENIEFDLAGEVSAATIGFTRERRIPLRVEQPSKVLGDPARTRQIIRNLLSNAIRHGGDDITIDVEPNGNRIALRVSDDGQAIDEPDRIFEMYERGPGSHTQPGSMGIGLTISRRLARLMGGDLQYHRVDGRSIFELLLPKTGG